MKFVKVFDVKRFTQVAMIRAQDESGAPCIKFFFQPEGYGVCHFSIGWESDEHAENKADRAFVELSLGEVIKIIDGWLKHTQLAAQKAH
jgi:hypothetical protein